MPSDSGERRAYPPPAQAEHLPCPRCDSTNTKFCYYNNYNLSQPRHFCKACRRYWTQGGTLRNIPVGGGTRKTTKRPRPSSSVMLDRPVEHHVNMIGSSANPISVSGEGSFTSLLAGYGMGGLGTSQGFNEMGLYGFGGRGIWGFPEVGNAAESGGRGGHGAGGLGSVWEANGVESGMVDGECFAPPELAIFMPGQGLK